MNRPVIINKFGRLTGWNTIKVNLLGRDLEGITELEYGDAVDKENVYGAGGYPVGRGEGNYTPKASITLLVEEVMSIQKSLPKTKGLTDIAPFDIIVQYEYENFVYTDIIRNAEFKDNNKAAKQGDKSISNKFELIVSHIEPNV